MRLNQPLEENNLKSNWQIIAKLLQTSPIMTISLDANSGEVLHANYMAYKTLGYSIEQLQSLNCWDFDKNCQIKGKDLWLNFIRELKQNGNINDVNTTWVTFNGENLSVNCNFALITIGAREIVICLCHDLNYPSVEIAKEKKLLQLETIKLNNYQGLWQEIAHEISNPLAILHTGIYNLTKAIANEDWKRSKDITKTLQTSTNSMCAVIQNLKRINRGEIDHTEKAINLYSSLENICQILDPKLNRFKVKTSFINNTSNTVIINPTAIEQVLINLIGNAIDAIKNIHESERWIKVVANDYQGGWQISVENGGDPIAKEIASKIFSPYFTTKANDNGTGLGLSISRKILAAYNGNLYLDQNSSKTRFVLELPSYNEKRNNSNSLH